MFGWLGLLSGILLVIIGGFLVVFFPATEEHQGGAFSVTGIIIGFVLLAAGVLMVFF